MQLVLLLGHSDKWKQLAFQRISDANQKPIEIGSGSGSEIGLAL